uniref:hypothetical protein n=1 Tax=Algoriphagus litoralis TaxID=2202829 RepID=UPI001E5102AE
MMHPKWILVVFLRVARIKKAFEFSSKGFLKLSRGGRIRISTFPIAIGTRYRATLRTWKRKKPLNFHP